MVSKCDRCEIRLKGKARAKILIIKSGHTKLFYLCDTCKGLTAKVNKAHELPKGDHEKAPWYAKHGKDLNTELQTSIAE